MINGYKSWIYLVCLYEYGLIIGISGCFDNEESANKLAKHLKDDMDPTIEYRVVKRALLQ